MAGEELLDGLSFDDFVLFDDNLSSNVTIEGDWEQAIMYKATGDNSRILVIEKHFLW